MKSELFPEELQKELSANHPLRSQNGKGKKVIVYYHFFIGSMDFWITEGNQENDDFTFYGITKIHETEFGYISLKELESITVKVPMLNSNKEINGYISCKVERDIYFEPTKAVKIKEIAHLFE